MGDKTHLSLMGKPIRKSLYYSFIVSYLIVLCIPIICSVAVFYRTEKSMREELQKTNSAILMQTSQILDKAFEELDSENMDVAMSDKLASILHIQPPLDSIKRYNISNVIRNELRGRYQSTYIENIYMYFIKGNFILTQSANYTPELAYEKFAADYFDSYEAWASIMQEPHYHTILNLDDHTLLYLQSIPYTGSAAANIAITIQKDSLIQLLESIEWVQDNVFAVFDQDGTLILTNREEFLNIQENRLGEGPDLTFQTEEGKMTGSRYQSTQTGWSYYLFMLPEYLDSNSKPLHNIFLIFFIGTILLGVLASVVFSRRNYTPIHKVVRTLRNSLPSTEEKNELLYLDSSVRKMLNMNADITRQLSMQKDQMRQNYLSRMLRGRINLRYLDSDSLKAHDLIFQKDNFIIALFRIDKYDEYFGDLPVDQNDYPLDSMDFSLIMLLQELIQTQYTGYVCEVNGMVAAVINYAQEDQNNIEQQLCNIREFVLKSLFIELTVSISSVHKSVAGLCDAYEEASLALEQSIFTKENTQHILQYVSGEHLNNYGFPTELEQSLASSLRSGNCKQSLDLLQAVFDKCFSRNTQVSPEMIRCLLYDVAATFVRAAEGLGMPDEKWNTTKFLSKLNDLHAAEQIEKYFMYYAECICTFADSGKESHNEILLKKITNYLWEHYADTSLNNDQIADAVGISAAYLSRFFKQQVGEGLLTYINRIRIEQAKHLLSQEPNLTIQEVGQQVGFETATTFIRIFKKQEGTTPGRYQSMR